MRSIQLSASLAVSVAALSLAACGSSKTPTPDAGTGPCAGVSGTCVPFIAGTTTEAEVDSAFSQAANGTTLAFGPGTFNFVNTLNLVSQNDIKVIGAGIDVTILDFTQQTAGSDGLDALTLSDLTFYNFTIQNSRGNAFKVTTSQNIIFESVKAAWTAAGTSANINDGPYGLYPVNVQNILMENCIVTGASDSGIYIGQSSNIIVRNNALFNNVAGIEFENSFFGEAYGNDSHDNTAGLLVFDLPGLPQEGGHDIHIHDNQLVNNNGGNFAVVGDIVAEVPAGTGFFVMANHDVEVNNNTVTGNNTIGMGVISYYTAQLPFTDTGYYPYPHNIWLHDNTVSGNGTSPDPSVQIGLIFLAEQPSFPGGHAPDLGWDGVYDPAWAADAGTLYPDGGTNGNPMEICFTNNGSTASFVDLNLCQLEIYGDLPDAGIDCPGVTPPATGGDIPMPDGGLYPTNLALIDNTDITPFDCDSPTVAPIDAGVYFSDAGL